MEPNNFEKKVQQKLDELKIAPPDFVWVNIEKKIGKRERDRKGILFFFLFLLILCAGYWFIKPGKNDTRKKSIEIASKQTSKPTNIHDSSSHQLVTGDTKKTNRLNEPANANISQASGKSFAKNKGAYSKSTNNNDFYSRHSLIKPIKGSTPNKTIVKTEINKPQDQLVSNGQINTKATHDSSANLSSNRFTNRDNNKSDEVEKNNKKITPATKNISAGNDAKDEKKQDQTTAAVKNASSLKKSAITNKKYSWIPGITLSGGTSWISTGTFEENYAYLSAPGAYNGGSSGGYAYYPPSAFKSSIALVAGFFLEKNISLKSKISFGLTYKYFSVVNKVGSRIDSFNSTQNLSSNLYSASNNVHSFRNNFHFLEIPVSIKFRLNKNDKLTLSWNAGINISELISTNALQFDSGSSVYYHDNSFFKKLQFGLHTGLSATVFTSGKHPLTFGPAFYYSLTSLSNKGLYDNRHFNFIGINATILFRKK